MINCYVYILEQLPFSGEAESSEPPPPYFTSYGNADIQSQLSAKPGYEGEKLDLFENLFLFIISKGKKSAKFPLKLSRTNLYCLTEKAF